MQWDKLFYLLESIMQSILNFLSHYVTTYSLYLQSPIIWQVLFIYVVFMTLAIAFMFKKNKFEYFFPVLFAALIPSSCVYTYTFWSLW